ncbi:MAG: FMN-binding protein [Deltaproteobacteria bacterium]|nr:FMN-binding protein [Deltaproteobacteria bacterium]
MERSIFRRRAVAFWMGAVLSLLPSLATAKVFHSRQEAVQLAFPDADQIQSRAIVLTPEQQQTIERLALAPLEAKMVTLYTASKGTAIVGYACIETRIVRTLPGSFLVTLTPTGEVKTVMAVAFHEPEEYLPPERWLKQFEGKPLAPELQIHKDIQSIGGATLSSQSVTHTVRKVLAIYQVILKDTP